MKLVAERIVEEIGPFEKSVERAVMGITRRGCAIGGDDGDVERHIAEMELLTLWLEYKAAKTYLRLTQERRGQGE